MSQPWRFIVVVAGMLISAHERASADNGARPATVLTPEHTVQVAEALDDPTGLWVPVDKLTEINGFVLKPEGVCIGEICIPLSRKSEDKLVTTKDSRQYVNLTQLAKQLKQTVVADTEARVWSFGPVPPVEHAQMQHALAPDFALPDRSGKLVKLSDFRGRKVLLLTWASWCQCKQDLVGWQKIYEELKDKNFEIVAAAQDSDGEAAAGKSYDRAKATYTTLIDPEHTVSSLYQMVNVPSGVWIDEQGKIVRPAEVAYSTKVALLSIKVDGDKYVAALRDWVNNGDKSAYALPPAQLQERLAPRSEAAALADANFKLGVYFHQQKDDARADEYFAEAQRLQPDDWNYHRQQWSFGKEALKRWGEKFRALNGKEYYEPLKIEPVMKN